MVQRASGLPCNANPVTEGDAHGVVPLSGRAAALLWLATAGLVLPFTAEAAENGLTFWVPGLEGSFAALPGVSGWDLGVIYYHSDVSSGADAEFPRGGTIDVGLGGQGDLVLLAPGYVFEPPVLGGQFALSLLTIAGRNTASVDATLSGPNGNILSGNRTDAFTAFGDLVPQASLKWNAGVHNYLAYVTGDIPVGAYDPDRLANLGLGHAALDAGAGYTYFDPKKGHEFSIVSGMTYNFENGDTDYQSGVDWHVDLAAAQFLNEHLYVGGAGYFLGQLTDDRGEGAVLGGYRSSVAGIGPQIGYKFDAGEHVSGLVSFKGFYEFAADNRPSGWNTWLSLAFSPKPSTQ